MSTVFSRLRQLRRRAGDAGMSTVEYSVGLLAVAALAGLLFKIFSGGAVLNALTNLIMRALR